MKKIIKAILGTTACLLMGASVLSLSGCIGGNEPPITHEEVNIYAYDETYHWHKCGCGVADCELRYSQELHDFNLIDEEVAETQTTKTLACDCGKEKEEIFQSEEQMFNTAKTLFNKYINFEMAYTLIGGENDIVACTIDLQNFGYANNAAGENYFTKIIKEGNNYIVYNKSYSNKTCEIKTLDKVKEMLATDGWNLANVITLQDYNTWKTSAEGLTITKVGNVYTMTMKQELEYAPGTLADVAITFTKTEISTIQMIANGFTSITYIENSFNQEYFDSFDVSTGFPEPSGN